jgi:hypothetical protein
MKSHQNRGEATFQTDLDTVVYTSRYMIRQPASATGASSFS